MSILSRPGWANKPIITEAKGGKGSKYPIFDRVIALFDKNSLGKSYYNNISKIIDSLVTDREPYMAQGLSSLIYKIIKQDPTVVSRGDAAITKKVNEAIDAMPITDEDIIHAAKMVGCVFAKEIYGFNAVQKSELSEFDNLEGEDHPKKYDMSPEEIVEKFGSVKLKLNESLFDPTRASVNGFPYFGEYNDKPVTATLAKEYESGIAIEDIDPKDIWTFRLLKKDANKDPNDLDVDRAIISVSFKNPNMDFNEDEPEATEQEKDQAEGKEYMKLAAQIKQAKDIAARKAGKLPPANVENDKENIRSMFNNYSGGETMDEAVRHTKAERERLIREAQMKKKQNLQLVEEKYRGIKR